MTGLLFPKPAPREKKQPKPLRRSPPPRKHTGPDPANFRDDDVHSVHGSDPRCLLNGTRVHLEKHHILGRGELFGIRPDDERRAILSSVFNCAVIEHTFHDGGHRDHPFARALLLDVVGKKVTLAWGYRITDLDRAFIALANRWRTEHGL